LVDYHGFEGAFPRCTRFFTISMNKSFMHSDRSFKAWETRRKKESARKGWETFCKEEVVNQPFIDLVKNKVFTFIRGKKLVAFSWELVDGKHQVHFAFDDEQEEQGDE